MEKVTAKTTISLAVMMLFQYLMLAVWWVPLAAYLTNTGVEDNLKSLILSSMAVGSMVSPIIGAMADRYLSAQKVLAFSNLLTAALLAGAGLTTNATLMLVLIFLAMLFYMPSWSLTSAIVMTHAKPELFPRIRLFGSIGWVISGLFSFVAVRFFGIPVFDGGSLPILCGSGIAVIAAIIDFTLPDTPPNGKNAKFSISEVLGLKAFSLLRDRNYLIFVSCAFAAMFAYALYYTFGSQFLQDRQFKYITITMNWGQVVEFIFLFFTAAIITKLGFKKVIAIGIAAMTARYLAFYLGVTSDVYVWYIIGVLLHGIIFGLFFVGGQIYTDIKAPVELRSQAQGMMSFLLMGVALLLGNFTCGKLISSNTFTDASGAVSYNWPFIFGVTTLFSIIVLILFLVFFKQEKNK
jgi:nucleoside transporter